MTNDNDSSNEHKHIRRLCKFIERLERKHALIVQHQEILPSDNSYVDSPDIEEINRITAWFVRGGFIQEILELKLALLSVDGELHGAVQAIQDDFLNSNLTGYLARYHGNLRKASNLDDLSVEQRSDPYKAGALIMEMLFKLKTASKTYCESLPSEPQPIHPRRDPNTSYSA